MQSEYQKSTDTQLDVIAMPVNEGSVSAEDAPSTLPGERAYFTEGELLPWKNRWWRVHLDAKTQRIWLEMLKPTAASQKRLQRAEQWKQQHQQAVNDKHGKRITLMWKSAGSVGAQSGSPGLSVVSESTGQ